LTQIDGTKFRQWYEQRYRVTLDNPTLQAAAIKGDKHRKRHEGAFVVDSEGNATLKMEPKIRDQLRQGRILACISSRPGQSGRADGYILEGVELEFYLKQMAKKKSS